MKKRLIYLIMMITLLVADQLTKAWAYANLAGKRSVEIIGGFFYLTYAENTGAAWSILQGQRVFFIVIAVVAFVVLLIWFIRSKGWLISLSLSLMMAGTLGNLVDRIMTGRVRDWLDFYPLGYDFPIFNVADSCLTIGVTLLFIEMLVSETK